MSFGKGDCWEVFFQETVACQGALKFLRSFLGHNIREKMAKKHVMMPCCRLKKDPTVQLMDAQLHTFGTTNDPSTARGRKFAAAIGMIIQCFIRRNCWGHNAIGSNDIIDLIKVAVLSFTTE